MGRYIARRLAQSVIVVIGVSLLVFIILYQTGDPVALMASQEASQEDIERMRENLGLNRPWYVQYFDFASVSYTHLTLPTNREV